MANSKVLILGAGLSGLSTAWHLQKKGIDCQLFEKEAQTGGLCRSKKIKGFTFDYDGHLLHFKSNYAFGLVKKLLKKNLGGHHKSSWVYSYDRYTRYPFQANLYGLPAPVVKECLMGFIESSKNGHCCQPGNFLEWINGKFGSGIAKYFMVPYNRKFWTVEPQDMVCSWLEGVIPVPSLNQIVEGTIKENKKPLGYNAHFWYPKHGGINELPAALTGSLKNIHRGSEVIEIDLVNKQIRVSSGQSVKYDVLISTIPLPELPGLAKGLPAAQAALFKKLRWNSIFNFNIGLCGREYLGRHWVYFPDPQISFFRAGFFHNFSPSLAPKGTSALYTEVSYSKDARPDKNRIIGRILSDLRKVGIISTGQKIIAEDINDIKYGYPIYDHVYEQVRREIAGYLKSRDILLAGRYGSWRYLSMEEVILDARHVAAEAAVWDAKNTRGGYEGNRMAEV